MCVCVCVKALEVLSEHAQRASKMGLMGARALANVAYGVARSGRGKSFEALLTAVARAGENRGKGRATVEKIKIQYSNNRK